ncbi:MAG TPA: hypothetical protein VF375_00075 [Candidatus Limnocylindrales bacterium]
MPNTPGTGPLQIVAYEPGVCNIGPAEISRRRRSGHAGLAVSLALFAVLLALAAPHWARLFLILTAAAAASGYLQARLHFCAAFGSTGVFNFGELGASEQVLDQEARRRDRMRSLQIGLASLAIGLAVGIGAFLLPIR